MRPVWRSLRNIVLLRYGLAFLALVGLWSMALSLLAPDRVVGNGLRLETYAQLLFIAATNWMVTIFAVAVMRVLLVRYRLAKGRLWQWIGDGNQPWSNIQFLLTTLISLITPCFVLFFYGSEFSGLFLPGAVPHSIWVRLLLGSVAIGSGVAAGRYLALGLGRFKCRLFGSEKQTANFLPFEDVDSPGWLGHQKRTWQTWFEKRFPCLTFEEIDIQLTLYVGLVASLYAIVTNHFPNAILNVVSGPAAAIILLWIALMCLSGIAYWLDMVRVPPLVAALLVISLLNATLAKEWHWVMEAMSITKAL